MTRGDSQIIPRTVKCEGENFNNRHSFSKNESQGGDSFVAQSPNKKNILEE